MLLGGVFVLALGPYAEKLFASLLALLTGLLGLLGKSRVIWAHKLVVSGMGVLVVAQDGLEKV